MDNLYPYAYLKKAVCKIEDAVIPIQSKVVQYGLGVFSGVRLFWSEQEKTLYSFRLKAHFKRLKEAALITRMNLETTYSDFLKILQELAIKNKIEEDSYVRSLLYSASTQLTPRLNNPDDDLAIYMLPLANYFGEDRGLKVCISSWRRMDDDVISTKAKVTGSYINSALAKTEALDNGFDEAIFLNRDGKVCEASAANIFMLKDEVFYTPPLSSNNLAGITRKSLIKIIKEEMKMEVREENLDRSMIYSADELFFCGTAAKVSWVKEVDHRQIGSGEKGKQTSKLHQLYEEITIGKNSKYKNWLEPIYSK